MNPAEAARGAIERCGSLVTLRKDEAVYHYRACIQPVGGARVEAGRFGLETQAEFLYAGAVSGGGEFACDGDVIEADGAVYLLDGCRDHLLGGTVIYRQAVALPVRKEGADAGA